MYPYSSTTVADTSESVQTAQVPDAVETTVQGILAELEQLAPEIQLAVYARLLNGLATRLTTSVVAKAITSARTQGTPAKPKATTARGRVTSRPESSPDVPRADSLLRQLSDATDPIEAWQRFGGTAAQVFDVLKYEPTGVLDAMLSHRNMPQGTKPRGKSREKLAEAIAVRLEQHFGGGF